MGDFLHVQKNLALGCGKLRKGMEGTPQTAVNRKTGGMPVTKHRMICTHIIGGESFCREVTSTR